MSNIDLYWKSIIKYIELEFEKDNCKIKDNAIPGIYIWGFKNDDCFNPYYVGRAQHIYMRMAQHFAYILGGLYTIFPKEKLLDSENVRDKNTRKFNETSSVYWPGDLREIYSFYRMDQKSIDHVIWMAENMHFTFAELEVKEERETAEKYLIKTIGKQNLINTRGGDHTKYSFKNSPECKSMKKMLEAFKLVIQ